MQQRKYFNAGGEFSPTGKGIFYPGDMPLGDMQKFAFAFVHRILQKIIYAEVKVSKIGGLGLAWEIIEFGEDADDKKIVFLRRKYTFTLDPAWKIIGFRDQWLSVPYTPRCEEMEEGNTMLQKVTDQVLEEIAEKYAALSYQPSYKDKYLKNSSLTNILSLSLRSFGQQPTKKDRLTKEIRKYAQGY